MQDLLEQLRDFSLSSPLHDPNPYLSCSSEIC